MEALKQWVNIEKDHKKNWCTKRIYKRLKKKLPV